MCQEDSLLVGGPLEEHGILRAANRFHVLGPDYVEMGNPPQEPAENPAIEVLVRKKTNHD